MMDTAMGAPMMAWTPGGRESTDEMGSRVFEGACTGEANGAGEFHEYNGAWILRDPQLTPPAGVTPAADLDEKDPKHGQRTVHEVYKAALGVLQKDDVMRSTMGMRKDVADELMPLPVPLADTMLAALVTGINHLGGWKNPPPGPAKGSDLRDRAVKNLSALLHRHGMWRIAESELKRHAIMFLDRSVSASAPAHPARLDDCLNFFLLKGHLSKALGLARGLRG